MIRVTVAVGDYRASAMTDAPYSPDVLDDLVRQCTQSVDALTIAPEGDDLDDYPDPDG